MIRREDLERRALADIADRLVSADKIEAPEYPETQLDAPSDIRSLIGRITLHPGDKRREVHATLHGELMTVLDVVNGSPKLEVSRAIMAEVSGSQSHRCYNSLGISI